MRFAWWGAEESNLVGSTFYVEQPDGGGAAKIALYLNFDMIGSPNYTFGVYDGDDSAAEGSGPGPAGSAQIEAVFQAFFAVRGEATCAGRLHRPLRLRPVHRARGIPAGGLFTGAEVQKTAADVALWGGIAGAAVRPVLPRPVRQPDTRARRRRRRALRASCARVYRLFGNVNTFAIDTNADAIATAVATFAYDTSTIPPRAAGGGRPVMAAPAAAPDRSGRLARVDRLNWRDSSLGADRLGFRDDPHPDHG